MIYKINDIEIDTTYKFCRVNGSVIRSKYDLAAFMASTFKKFNRWCLPAFCSAYTYSELYDLLVDYLDSLIDHLVSIGFPLDFSPYLVAKL